MPMLRITISAASSPAFVATALTAVSPLIADTAVPVIILKPLLLSTFAAYPAISGSRIFGKI